MSTEHMIPTTLHPRGLDISTTQTPSHAAPDATLLMVLLPHWTRLLNLCQSQSEHVTSDMLQTLAQLAPFVRHQPAASAMLAELQEALQQQDRQRQMLALLTQDMQDAAALSADRTSPFNLNAWLERFDKKCPLPELRRGNANAALPQDDPGKPGIEFF